MEECPCNTGRNVLKSVDWIKSLLPLSAARETLSFVSACPQLADGAYDLLSNMLTWPQDLVFKGKRVHEKVSPAHSTLGK
jgi:hypothetical protein